MGKHLEEPQSLASMATALVIKLWRQHCAVYQSSFSFTWLQQRRKLFSQACKQSPLTLTLLGWQVVVPICLRQGNIVSQLRECGTKRRIAHSTLSSICCTGNYHAILPSQGTYLCNQVYSLPLSRQTSINLYLIKINVAWGREDTCFDDSLALPYSTAHAATMLLVEAPYLAMVKHFSSKIIARTL